MPRSGILTYSCHRCSSGRPYMTSMKATLSGSSKMLSWNWRGSVIGAIVKCFWSEEGTIIVPPDLPRGCQESKTLLFRPKQLPSLLKLGQQFCSICSVCHVILSPYARLRALVRWLESFSFVFWRQAKAAIFFVWLTFTSLNLRNDRHSIAVFNWTNDLLRFKKFSSVTSDVNGDVQVRILKRSYHCWRLFFLFLERRDTFFLDIAAGNIRGALRVKLS